MTHDSKQRVGFIGLGEMGAPMVANLVAAGYTVSGFDLDEQRLRVAGEAGVTASSSMDALVAASDVVITSLPSSDAFVAVAETGLLPVARPGQLFIEMGTTSPPDMRRLAAAFQAQGAHMVDAPVSGGPRGAEQGSLYVFVGGTDEAVALARPLLAVLGDPGRMTHGGGPGAGQVLKGVNQLMMGLLTAACIESVAFGVRGGVDAQTVAQAVGGEGRWRRDFQHVAERIAAGGGQDLGVKFRELPYFLKEAAEQGFELPLTRVLHDHCDKGERVAFDDHRPAPSYWHELVASDRAASGSP